MSGFAGTGTLLRLALRRDRVLLPLTVLGLVILAVSSAQATLALYPTTAAMAQGLPGVLDNPALLAMYGPLTNPTSPDSFAVYKTVIMGGVLLALAVYALIRRHTRTEEEAGRLELIGAGVVGRRAALSAAILLALTMTALTCVITAAGMLRLGMEPAGTVIFCLGWLTVGLTMTGITAIAAQVTTTARGCGALAVSALGLAFALRAIGDAVPGAGALTWLSFLGWAEHMQPYGANRTAVALIPIAVTAVLVVIAFALLDRRDLGAGLVASRPGPAQGAPGLASPLGLAWRLQRWSLAGWSLGVLMGGAMVGSIAGQVETMLSDPAARDMLVAIGGGSGTLTNIFFAAEFMIVALVISAYGIATTMRLRGEERDVHAEAILANATSRWRWLGSHVLVALAGTAWLLFVLGASSALVRGLATRDVGHELATLVPAAMAPLPAVWICVGVTLLVFGVAPRFTSIAWGALVFFLVVGELGSLLGLPTWVSDLSPFTHLPRLPGGAVSLVGLATLAAIALALLSSGSAGFRRRDLAT